LNQHFRAKTIGPIARAGSVIRINEDVLLKGEWICCRVESEANVKIVVVIRDVEVAVVNARWIVQRIGVRQRNAGPIPERTIYVDGLECAGKCAATEQACGGCQGGQARKLVIFHRSGFLSETIDAFTRS
jgi:hypothetical protein